MHNAPSAVISYSIMLATRGHWSIGLLALLSLLTVELSFFKEIKTLI